METSKALTIPSLIFAISLTFAGSADAPGNATNFNYNSDGAIYQTTSISKMDETSQFFSYTNPRNEALALFGIQSNFTYDEQETYKMVLGQKSQDANINLFDLF